MWSLIENTASLVECIIITGFTTLVLGYKNPRHKYLKYIIYTLAVFIDCIFLVNYLPPKIAETFPGILQILLIAAEERGNGIQPFGCAAVSHDLRGTAAAQAHGDCRRREAVLPP